MENNQADVDFLVEEVGQGTDLDSTDAAVALATWMRVAPDEPILGACAATSAYLHAAPAWVAVTLPTRLKEKMNEVSKRDVTAKLYPAPLFLTDSGVTRECVDLPLLGCTRKDAGRDAGSCGRRGTPLQGQ